MLLLGDLLRCYLGSPTWALEAVVAKNNIWRGPPGGSRGSNWSCWGPQSASTTKCSTLPRSPIVGSAHLNPATPEHSIFFPRFHHHQPFPGQCLKTTDGRGTGYIAAAVQCRPRPGTCPGPVRQTCESMLESRLPSSPDAEAAGRRRSPRCDS